MDDLLDGATTYVRGSFHLLIGNIISFLIMAAGSILVARMLSPSEYGLYGVALILPNLLLLFSGWGISSALTRYIARYRSEGAHGKIVKLERAAFLLTFCIGGSLSLILYIFADTLANVLLGRPELGGFVRTASSLILFQSLYSTVFSALVGLERMDLRAVINVIQSVVKGISSPVFIYLGFGVSGPIIGHISGYVVASILGLFFVLRSSPNLENVRISNEGLQDNVLLLLGFGLPLFFGSLVNGLAGRLQSFILSWFVSDEVFGNYHVAVNFSTLIGLVSGSISVSLYPIFSKFNYNSQPEKTRAAFQLSVRYSSMFIIPIIFLMATVSKPLIYVLYTTRYPQAPILLVLLLLPNLLIGIGALSIGNFLNSQNDTKTNLRVILVGSIVSIIVSPVLIWMWGVFGLAFSIIISRVVQRVYGFYVVYKRYDIYSDLWNTSKTILCSLISASLTFLITRLLIVNTPLLNLILSSGLFFILYLIIAPLIGAIEDMDLDNLDSMLKDLVFVYPFARICINVERNILKLTRKRN